MEFHILYKWKAENQLKFKKYNAPRRQYIVRVHTTVKLLRRETPDFIIAPNLWLLNISDFSPVDYRILAMLWEWVSRHPMRHVDKLRQRLIDRQTVIDQSIN